MNINEMKVFDCPCGQIHDTVMDHVDISLGAVGHIPAYLHEKGIQSVFVVADKHTYKAAGELLVQNLTNSSIDTDLYVIPGEGEVVPDERVVLGIMIAMKKDYDLIIGVGSGTINDMCKFVSWRLKMNYIICATAPSMDGYASVGAPLMINNLKTTLDCHVPMAIFADVDVLRRAPMNMIHAGLGDILGKYTCLTDWKLSHIINDEYYCQHIVDMVEGYIKKVVDTADQVNTRSPEAIAAIAAITEALIGTGIAMSFVGNSRPASGSEHHISHYWEMKYLMAGKTSALHGIQVEIGTVGIVHLYEELMKMDVDFDKAKAHAAAYDEALWEEKMKELYLVSAPGVIDLEKEVQKNGAEGHAARIAIIEEKWEEIRAMIKDALPTVDHVLGILQSLGAPYKPSQVGIDDKLVSDSIVVAKEVRNRYGLLQLLWDLGLEEEMGDNLAAFYHTI